MDRATASSIVGIYAASVYLSSLPGGWIADRWLGLRRSIWYGGVLIALGHLSIALSIIFAQTAFFIGLILIVLGTGLLKPNISAIVGDLYPEGGSRRDAGFSIFYMGINIGALVAPLITGVLGERVGWSLGFGAAGLGIVIGLVTYRMRGDKTLGDVGVAPGSSDPAEHRRVKLTAMIGVGVIALLVLLTMSGVIHINAVSLAQKMTYVIVGSALLYFIYLFVGGGLTGEEKKRVIVIILLFVFAAIFWSAFEQAPTSLNLFARDFTNRVVFGWELPTMWIKAAN
jgi:POT family proton-dependent oligopeptide transporter